MAKQKHDWAELKLKFMMSHHKEIQPFLQEEIGKNGEINTENGNVARQTEGWRKEKENFLLNVQNEALMDYKKKLKESIEPNIKEALEMKKASLDLAKVALKYEQDTCLIKDDSGKVSIIKSPNLSVIDMGYRIGKNELGEASETTKVLSISQDDQDLIDAVLNENL